MALPAPDSASSRQILRRAPIRDATAARNGFNAHNLVALGLFGTVVGRRGTARAGVTEVVVTAENRAETVLHVPLSITAINDLTIERAGISDFTDYALKAPNLTRLRQMSSR